MWFLSKLCRCLQDPEGEGRKTYVEATASADSTDEKLAQSSRDSPTSPVSDPFLRQKDTEALTPVADQPNYTDLPQQSSQNNRELEFEKFRQGIDKWKEWKQGHSDQKWIHTVKDLVDENSPFLEMLPDGMIPIRGLVKSLIYTCKKAADFALAKEEVHLFVQEINKWLDVLRAFDRRNGFRSEVWQVLNEIRQLVGEVIRWSSGLQVVSSQWLYVESQIQAYRKGFTEISTRFGIVLGIQLIEGLDGVAQKVESVARDIKNISENDNTIKRLELLKKQLQPRLNEKETYNDQDKRPCDPETRLEILEEIRTWTQSVSESSQCFYWLSGAPGVGKSAITASIAKECLDLGILGAQFFINRNDATSTDPRVLFPTICWRLCERFPKTVAVTMEEVLRTRPTLVDDISEDQAIKFFVNAIESAATVDRSKAVVIVIDALDETDTKRLRDLATIFSKVVADLPQNAKVFISSRAEDAITKPFNSLRLHKRVKSRYLAAEQSITDVSRFMEKEVKKILDDYEMDWDVWGDDAMKTLSSQASGLFIWAETALKFLRNEIQHKGKACFKGLLDVLETNGMNDINKLYLTILRRTCEADDWEYQRFRRIIGAILVRQTPLSIADMTQLLDLKERSNSQPVDLVHFVRQYRTILVDNARVIHDGLVPRMHKSFSDFITSERAEEFRVDRRASHGELALRCIGQLDDLMKYLDPEEETQVSFPSQLVYVSQYWQSHLTRIIEPGMDNDTGKMKEYDMPDVPEDNTQSLLANPRDKKDLKPDGGEIARRWSLSLAFSPDGIQFAIRDGDDIRIRDASTGLTTLSLVGHRDSVTSIGFSPDGTQLVSASYDHTARIWDTRTGEVLHVLRGHSHWVEGAVFSHDGSTVVTCSYDWTLRTWDSSTGQQLNTFNGHGNPVCYCTFSLNNQRITSCSFHGDEIIVWNVNSGNIISEIKHKECRVIAFCLCGNHLISHDYYGKTMLWEVESGKQVHHINSTSRLAFIEEPEQSASAYIDLPPAIQECVDSNTPLVYTFETEYGSVDGIAEHGQDVWVSDIGGQRVFFAVGATRIY